MRQGDFRQDVSGSVSSVVLRFRGADFVGGGELFLAIGRRPAGIFDADSATPRLFFLPKEIQGSVHA
jgi:hypothetical protein